MARLNSRPKNPAIYRPTLEELEARLTLSYTIAELASWGEGSRAVALNNNGQVTGRVLSGGAFYYNGVRSIPINLNFGVPQDTFAVAISDAGYVTGTFRHPMAPYLTSTYLWNEVDGGIDIGQLDPGAEMYPSAVNNFGQVVGRSGSPLQHAYLYSASTIIDLGTLGGALSSSRSLNDAGTVVGSAQINGGQTHAFLWTGGWMTDLGTLGGATSGATFINPYARVFGFAEAKDGISHAFLYSDGQMNNLDSIVGPKCSASMINEMGQIIGTCSFPDGHSRAFLYTPKTGTQDLGTLQPDEDSRPTGINGQGQVVGFSGNRPFLYSDGQMVALADLLLEGSGWNLRELVGINDAGQIAGTGTSPANGMRAFLISPDGGYPGPSMSVSYVRAAFVHADFAGDPYSSEIARGHLLTVRVIDAQLPVHSTQFTMIDSPNGTLPDSHPSVWSSQANKEPGQEFKLDELFADLDVTTLSLAGIPGQQRQVRI